MHTGYSKYSTCTSMYRVTPVCSLAVRCCLDVAEDVEGTGLVACMTAGLSSSLSDPVLSTKCKVIQESCAIAKMTARCALYIGYSTLNTYITLHRFDSQRI